VLQCSLCLLAPPPAKVSGSHQNTSDYAGTVEWAQLDLQSIQHHDYFGHLSIFGQLLFPLEKCCLNISLNELKLSRFHEILNQTVAENISFVS